MVLLRAELADYVVAINREWAETGMPMMRPMFLAWPLDPACQGRDVEDQFMFGPNWLAAPITTYQTYSRSVYLPLLDANHTWVYFFNLSEVGQGGSRITMPAPVTEFPLFFRRALGPPPPAPCTPGTWGSALDGFLAAGDDVLPAGPYTLDDAKALCAKTSGCVGLTFEAASAAPVGTIPNVYFKSQADESDAAGWFSYVYCR